MLFLRYFPGFTGMVGTSVHNGMSIRHSAIREVGRKLDMDPDMDAAAADRKARARSHYKVARKHVYKLCSCVAGSLVFEVSTHHG